MQQHLTAQVILLLHSAEQAPSVTCRALLQPAPAAQAFLSKQPLAYLLYTMAMAVTLTLLEQVLKADTLLLLPLAVITLIQRPLQPVTAV